ncbi:hypothetical protein [Actinomadura nitritigenes]|uniref:hypothetical protein n=1 Tax=Actinomadura nitritigenes TaxID=134602 RepID=UPI003D8DB31C
MIPTVVWGTGNVGRPSGPSARIHPSCAPDWPMPPSGDGAHRVVIEGDPRIEATVEATCADGNRSAGGNATAVGRLVGAIDWLATAEPGLYDALDVPLCPTASTRSSGPG